MRESNTNTYPEAVLALIPLLRLFHVSQRLSTVRVGDPLTLSVGNEKKFYCQPGVVGKKMAVQVIGKIDQSESDEFEELSVEGDESYE